jgi:hypothetical protein
VSGAMGSKGDDRGIKWPTIFIGRNKVAGILIVNG